MLLLTLTSRRIQDAHSDMAALVSQGDIARAIEIGRSHAERDVFGASVRDRAVVGQLLGRCLLAAGREEDAEDLFRRLARLYSDISRPHVRWMSGLDQGAMLLHLNRPSRAAEALCAVADDPTADAALRLEAMAAAGVALHRAGDCRQARRSLEAARRMAASGDDRTLVTLVDGIALELAALQISRCSGAIEDHALHGVYRESAAELAQPDLLRRQLRDAAAALDASAPMAAQRLRTLSHAAAGEMNAGPMVELLGWVRARRLTGLEPELRVESALLMLAGGSIGPATEMVSPQCGDENQLRRSRHAVDLHYLMSRVSLSQGRAADALRWYRSHSQEAVRVLVGHGGRRLAVTYLGTSAATDASVEDASRVRLPLRYRRAYTFIVENLHDETLSVQRVAAELGVTERALQMAFRTHLGVTPAEFMRNRRAERVHEDLVHGLGDENLVTLAQRHGIRNRSTLSSNYRTRFAETPMQTLRGTSTADAHAA